MSTAIMHHEWECNYHWLCKKNSFVTDIVIGLPGYVVAVEINSMHYFQSNLHILQNVFSGFFYQWILKICAWNSLWEIFFFFMSTMWLSVLILRWDEKQFCFQWYMNFLNRWKIIFLPFLFFLRWEAHLSSKNLSIS